ncbi:MAG: MFS transporter [Alphaproteobacteria bacterium]|nr:MAG: MFS transporter [Alphaproteobacteria bacterium]
MGETGREDHPHGACEAGGRRTLHRLLAPLVIYGDRRVLSFLFFGFASGLPIGLIGETWRIRLTDAGVDLGLIGLTSLIGAAYATKFVWAPLMDHLAPPFGFARLGRRRGWMALLLAAMLVLAIPFALIDPAQMLSVSVLIAILIAFLSATFDIVVDAYRIERLGARRLAAGTAVHSGAWYLGAKFAGGFLVLYLAHRFGWPAAYLVAGATLALGLAATLMSGEPAAPEGTIVPPVSWHDFLKRVILAPFADLWQRFGPALVGLFAFVVFFKFQDAFAGALSGPFVRAIGYQKDTIAWVYKGFGLAAVFLGMFTAGAIMARVRLGPALWLAAGLQIVSNLGFSWLALTGDALSLEYAALAPLGTLPEILVHWRIDGAVAALAAVTGFENFASGLGNTLFVVFLSRLVHIEHTASQYAVLSSAALTARTFLAAPAGYLAEATGWPVFFALSALAGLPGLALLWWASVRLPATLDATHRARG